MKWRVIPGSGTDGGEFFFTAWEYVVGDHRAVVEREDTGVYSWWAEVREGDAWVRVPGVGETLRARARTRSKAAALAYLEGVTS